MTTNTKSNDVLVPQECGCVQRWMPEMEDLLGTNRCAAHQSQYNDAVSNSDGAVYVIEDLPLLVMHAATHWGRKITKDPVTGEWVEDPICHCGLPW